MAYCTEAQVEGEFKDVDFSASTVVTSDDITRFIAEADALIDGHLAGKYDTPITGATSLLIVRTISVLLVASRVRKILEVKGGDSSKGQAPKASEKKQAMSMLKQIKEGKILLTDATLANSYDGVKSYTSANDVTPETDVEEELW